MSSSPIPVDARGFLLLTLPSVQVFQLFEGQSVRIAQGELMVECLALPRNATANLTTASGNVVKPNPFSDDPAPNQDLYLIMKSGDFEICLVPGVKMERQPSFEASHQGGQGYTNITFRVPSTTVKNAFVEIVVPRPSTEEDQQDLETCEVLLKQYGVLHIPPQYVNREIPGSSLIESVTSASTPASPIGGKSANPPPIPPRPGMRHSASGGRFVLVDETTGQIVGELDQQLSVEEGKQVMGNSSSEPVIVDFGQLDAGVIGKITVKTIDEADMNDWMLKGAHFLSKGILSLGNSASSGITSAAEYYTKNTKPATEPVKLGSVTKGSIRTVHNVSTRGLKVTRKTLGVVQDAIGGVIDKAASAGFQEYDELRGKTPPGSRPAGAQNSVHSNEKAAYNAPGAAPPAYTSTGSAPVGMSNEKPSLSRLEPTPHSSPQTMASSPSSASGSGRAQKGFWTRVFTAADVIGTSIEATTANLIESTTSAASVAAEHKYGPEAGHATRILGGSVHNVALVYVDVRGVGRKTLIQSGKKGLKGSFRTRLESGEEVTIKPEEGANGQFTQDLTVQVNSSANPSSAMSTSGYMPNRTPLDRRLESVAHRGEKKTM